MLHRFGPLAAILRTLFHEEYEAVSSVFDTMESHLRIMQPIAPTDIDHALREPSVKLLAQILVVLGMKLGRSKELSSAFEDLRRLATGHHQAVSAVTLYTAQQTMGMLTKSVAWDEQELDVTRKCLAEIAETARNTYDLIRRIPDTTRDEIAADRTILDNIQSTLLNMVADSARARRTSDIDKIFGWLQYPDCSAKMNDLLYDRANSTGLWLIDGQAFASLKSGDRRSLWMYGPEGSLAPLLNLWKGHMSGHTQPSIETMQRHLRQALETAPSRVFLVVDALDEADDRDIIPFLMSLLDLPTVSLLLSSRSELLGREYLERRCDAPISVNDYVVSRDIERLLDQTFAPGGALSRVVDAGTARQALSAGADGK
ncbi:hypothetical protein K525DRAFT_287676 [Schizophyllum commune Loenen D]|nr:hypothetical protein K525DRAFT_287676 [Schizophyllum commune Loenen D]